jgi:hypothetical protein
MNHQTRLELTDNGTTLAIKMSEGNPGALRVIVELMKEGNWIDPVGMGGVGAVLMMDTFGIYGSRIWMLYKDVCNQDIIKTMAVIRGCQLGILNEHTMNAAIDGASLDTDELLTKVQERLGNFGQKDTAVRPANLN